VFGRVFRKHLRQADGDVKVIDRLVANQIDIARDPANKQAVAAFVAIRDTVDGRPSSDDAGVAVGINVSVRTIGEQPNRTDHLLAGNDDI